MYKNDEMIPVQSSNIESVGYDEAGQEAYVRFLNGSVYVYRDVPQHEYDGLKDAPSVGSYLNRNFKNVYAYERIE
ncbi:MAG: KTSC domain-containing protein [Arcobacter sp.]|nr:MAG: KTSC domain-containing protein [Arcobacter sp.]